MGWTLRLSAQAARDLEGIVGYIARDDATAAERFGLALLTRSETLLLSPRLGVRVRGKPGVRALLYRNYYVIYRAMESTRTIEVIRFWHAARDLEAVREKDFGG